MVCRSCFRLMRGITINRRHFRPRSIRGTVVGRIQRALVSLVAAVPAGFLAFLLVNTFLNSADKLNTTFQVVCGIVLACVAVVILMPFALLIFGGPKTKSEDDDSPKGKAVEEDVETIDDDDAVEADEDVEEVEADEALGFDDSDGDIMADSDDEIATGSGSSLDEIETIDFEDDEAEEEEEPAPKKRKK